jgi:hypothetical protein
MPSPSSMSPQFECHVSMHYITKKREKRNTGTMFHFFEDRILSSILLRNKCVKKFSTEEAAWHNALDNELVWKHTCTVL